MKRWRMLKDAYYTSRPKPDIDYEEGYWHRKDPDGKMRDRDSERELALGDLNDEITFIKNRVPGKILDVGCGFGFLLSALPTWERYGVDLSRCASEEAREHGEIFVGDFLDFDHPANQFDVITMTQVIEHLEDPVAALHHAYSLLKSGGHLIITTPNFGSPVAKMFGENYRLLHDPTHISLFDDSGLRLLLGHMGFNVLKVEFPFFNTRHFTKENLLRLFDTSKVSPPFYGNIMSFYVGRP
jgi:2-polyprenyl-3-methyl-5-hydroxy-6-metoxy-1,4-benzoquinol methylase